MPKYMRAYCDRAAAEQGKPGDPIRFVASTEGKKRDGKNLRSADWRFDNYKGNPVVLWCHQYMGQTLPIGRAEAGIDGDKAIADVVFDQEDAFARSVESKYRRGFLHAVSVGWNDVSEGGRVYHDLMDISAVPVPADPQALKMQSARAVYDVMAELEQMTEEIQDDAELSPVLLRKRVLDALDRTVAAASNKPDKSAASTRTPAGKMTVGNWFEASTRGDINGLIDWLFSQGIIDRDEMIVLINCLDSALAIFTQAIDATGNLRDREFPMWRAAQFAKTCAEASEPPPSAATGEHGKRGAIPPHTTPKADENAEWDAAAEVGKCPAEEEPLRRMHAWVDAEAEPNLKSAYKLPHHTAEGNVVWKGVAAAMARLMQQDTDIPDGDRKDTYVHLERHYKQFDKTAPEFRTNAELAVLGAGEIRGLFLEGEEKYLPPRPDFEFRSLRYAATGELIAVRGIGKDGAECEFEISARAGAVLNARNRGDLERAVDLVQGVLERAKTESGDEGKDDSTKRNIENGSAESATTLNTVLAQLKETQTRITGGQNA